MTRIPLVEFERSLRSGHGRALRDVRENGLGDRRAALIAACVRNVAFDPQFEYDRGAWLIEIADTAGVVAELVDPVCEALSTVTIETDYPNQLCDLALGLALRGHARAGTALESFVARTVQPDDDQWATGREQLARLRSETLASGDEPDSAERQAARAVKRAENERTWAARTFDEMQVLLREGLSSGNQIVLGLPTWGRHASAADLERAFDEFVAGRNDDRRMWLRAFLHRPPSRWDAALAAALESDRPFVRSAAFAAITNLAAPEARALGFARLTGHGLDYAAGALLASNLRAGDEDTLLAALPAPDAGDRAIHDAVVAICDMTEVSPLVAGSLALLTWSFEMSPCSRCRDDIAEYLVPLGPGETLLADARCDANGNVRRIAGATGPVLEPQS